METWNNHWWYANYHKRGAAKLHKELQFSSTNCEVPITIIHYQRNPKRAKSNNWSLKINWLYACFDEEIAQCHNAILIISNNLLLLETPTGLPVMIKGYIKDRNWYTSTQIFSALLLMCSCSFAKSNVNLQCITLGIKQTLLKLRCNKVKIAWIVDEKSLHCCGEDTRQVASKQALGRQDSR